MDDERGYSNEFVERRPFDYNEKKTLLKQTGGICACCGKKLTTKTMTVDHIIPISRGGNNHPNNLTVLCETCNKDKSNHLYLPVTFFQAITATSRVYAMNQLVENWFRDTQKEHFPIERYPLIAPQHNFLQPPIQTTRKPIYHRQFVYQWEIIGQDDYEEIEAITETNLRVIRTFLERFKPEISSFDPALPWYEQYQPITFYKLHKLTNDKLIAVVALRYDKTRKDLVSYLIWTDMTSRYLPALLPQLLFMATHAIVDIAEESIESYCMLAHQYHALDYFRKGYAHNAYGWRYGKYGVETHYFDTIGKEYLYAICSSYEPKFPDCLREFITIPKWLEQIDLTSDHHT